MTTSAYSRLGTVRWSSNKVQTLARRRPEVLLQLPHANLRWKSTAPSATRRRGLGPATGVQHRTQERRGREPNVQVVGAASPIQDLIPVEAHYISKDLYRALSTEQKRGDLDRDLSSTRPAPLTQPAPLSAQHGEGPVPLTDRAKHLYQIGRGYLSFYKTGLWNIWNNYKAYREVQGRLGNVKLEDAAKYGAKGGLPSITRREYQICARTRHDLFKLIPFGLIFAICGEFTPLIIIAVGSGVVPKTCHIPKQVQKDTLKHIRRKPMADMETAKYQQWLQTSNPDPTEINLRQELLTAYRCGLSPTAQPLPLLGNLFYRLRTKPRIQKWADEVLNDTVLIHREGGFSKLDPAELYEWAFKYRSPALHLIQQEIYAKHSEKDADVPTPIIQQLTRAFEDEANFILNHTFSRLPEQDRYLAVLARPDPAKMPRGYLQTVDRALNSIRDGV